MSDRPAAAAAWFADVDRADPDGAREAIADGIAASPADWPALAVESGFAADEDDYYDALRTATVAAARAEVRERERADDQQVKHAIRVIPNSELKQVGLLWEYD